MVELHNNDIQDFQFDALRIGQGFRDASDDDTRNVMNVMSNPNGTDPPLESLRFFAVPAPWFLRAWPILMARSADEIRDENWRQDVGLVRNTELIEAERAVSDGESDGEADNRKHGISQSEQIKLKIDRLHRRMARKQQTTKMKAGLVHTTDYFFLGPSAWMLVKSKFGFDGYEISRSCVALGKRGTIAIALLPDESVAGTSTRGNGQDGATVGPIIEIPGTGRFAYEKVVSRCIENGTRSRNSNISQDDPNEVDDERNNVISWADKEIDVTGNEIEGPPILLLPPSTTNGDQDESDLGSPLSPLPDDDMDVESNDRGSADSSMNGTKNTQVSGRKRLASGLGNLGNTCFMNSTLQCLAHTEPIRRYFLSGEYEKDLNRDNPLGTGGELATQFANLMSEIWGIPSKRRNVLGTHDFNNHYLNSSSSAVYPRSFKLCLGKHAEQFMGYDQHDSQELATYLLDALHEDTNRVTKKPYVEKPEQGEDEADDVAADKAWSLHLQREDSRVLENFMGQVKSRLECCQEGCNRVSTTFDPFMYLSVPIPGASDRILEVTFVPLDPNKRIQKLSLTVPKTLSIDGLMGKVNEDLIKRGFCEEAIPTHDLVPADVWSQEVFSWYKMDSEIDSIREADKTFVYQVRPLEEIQENSKKDDEAAASTLWESSTKRRLKLDVGDLTRLNSSNKWMEELESYMEHNRMTYKLFNPNRSTNEERMQFHRKLASFIDDCYIELERDESNRLKRTRDDTNQDGTERGCADHSSTEGSEVLIHGLTDLSNASDTFAHVKTTNDVAILEFCANKLRKLIVELIRGGLDEHADGILIQVLIKRRSGGGYSSRRDNYLTIPLILRLPGNATVYDLREELARKLKMTLNANQEENCILQGTDAGESSAESHAKPTVGTEQYDISSDSPELFVMRQTALSYERKAYPTKSNFFNFKRLGMIDFSFDPFDASNADQPRIAVASDEAEQALIADVVGNHGTVCITWAESFCDRVVDASDFAMADLGQNDSTNNSKEESDVITVLDCIKKYCQKEQLEETEKWYCNQCKDHVRAWKQFHLYRAPPILIIHLKRFHYSALTHRRDKITTYIDFPLEGLDLTELVSRDGENDKPIYDCYAVSNHYGGLGGGHYTAYTLSDDGSWCYYDDSRVTTNVDREKVVSEAAYVLYYRRRDVRVGDCNAYIDDGRASPMICEQADVHGETSEMSSNNTAHAGDMDVTLDDTVSNASSRTATSPVGSVGNAEKVHVDDFSCLVHRDSDHSSTEGPFLLQ